MISNGYAKNKMLWLLYVSAKLKLINHDWYWQSFDRNFPTIPMKKKKSHHSPKGGSSPCLARFA